MTLQLFGQGYRAMFDGAENAITFMAQKLFNPVSSTVLYALSYVFSAPLYVLDLLSTALISLHQMASEIVVLRELIGLMNNVVVKAQDITRSLLGMVFGFLKTFLVFDTKTSLDLSLYAQTSHYINIFNIEPKNVSVLLYITYGIQGYLHTLVGYLLNIPMFLFSLFELYLFVPLVAHIAAINQFLLSSLMPGARKNDSNINWQLPLALITLPLVFVLKLMVRVVNYFAAVGANAVSEYVSELFVNPISQLNPLELIGIGMNNEAPAKVNPLTAQVIETLSSKLENLPPNDFILKAVLNECKDTLSPKLDLSEKEPHRQDIHEVVRRMASAFKGAHNLFHAWVHLGSNHLRLLQRDGQINMPNMSGLQDVVISSLFGSAEKLEHAMDKVADKKTEEEVGLQLRGSGDRPL